MTTKDWTIASDQDVMDADLALELELDKLPVAVTTSLLERLAEQVQQAVLQRAVLEVSDAERQELEGLVAAQQAEAVASWLEQRFPDYAERFWQETVRAKRIMLTESPLEQELSANTPKPNTSF